MDRLRSRIIFATYLPRNLPEEKSYSMDFSPALQPKRESQF
jgi:hypothetical protein